MTKRIISTFLLLLMLLTISTYAEEPAEIKLDPKNTAKITLDVSEPDEDGYFTAKFIISNTTYKGFLCSLSYNAEAVTPVDFETKEPTNDFTKFAKKPTLAKNLETGEDITEWFTDEGSLINQEKSTIQIFNIIGLNQPFPNSIATANKQLLADENGIIVYEFLFKKISDELIKINLEYDYIPVGILMSNTTGALDCIFEVKIDENIGEAFYKEIAAQVSTQTTIVPSSDEEKEKVASARTIQAVFLQVGNYAAVGNKVLKWVDRENKNVIPYIKEDRTMVPIRFIAEQLDAKITYDHQNRKVTVSNLDVSITLTIDDKEYFIDGLKREMDVAAEVIEGRTFVPIRFISEALGKSVKWLQEEQMVIITQKEYPWDENNPIEKELLTNAKLLMSTMFRDFVK